LDEDIVGEGGQQEVKDLLILDLPFFVRRIGDRWASVALVGTVFAGVAVVPLT
jgi:hypothetical protein